ncbi:MAG TPA: tetratricopeptide repeat protein [Candidatus Cybelea sp.]
MQHISICRLASVAALCGTLALGGCASSITRWIANTRVHQGELSMAHGDARDAELAYGLALRVAPGNPRARTGFVEAAADLARAQFGKGDFDDALATVNRGLAIDVQSAPLAALKVTIEQAKLKREIVVSNYPTYRATAAEIQHAYQQLNVSNALLLRDLRRFGYTYDTENLSKAIKQSYALELDVAKNTNRLIAYRQLVSSGLPEVPAQSTTFGAASLLPLP